MRKTTALLLALALVPLIAGCSGGVGQQAAQGEQDGSGRQEAASMASGIDAGSQGAAAGGESSPDVTGQSDAARSLAMTVTVNGRAFPATIEDTEAGHELAARLPLALDMGELNGVEKYSYTGTSFGGEAEAPATIAAGDIMAYSGDCLVLFYVDHVNPGYSYVPLARIDDPDGLVEAYGEESATVSFEAAG